MKIEFDKEADAAYIYFKEIGDRRNKYNLNISTPDRFFTNFYGKRIVSQFNSIDTKDPRGLGCSPGKASGKVKILKNLELNHNLSDKIIVTERTEPSWAVILPLCKGIIVERGSILSHTSIISRELGIPSIVGVKNATTLFKDGDRITIDGSTGMITKSK